MSLSVIRPRSTPDHRTSTDTDQYEKAGCVTVQNGHLQVKIRASACPGTWWRSTHRAKWLYATADGETVAA
jgi:hypothetical protein